MEECLLRKPYGEQGKLSCLSLGVHVISGLDLLLLRMLSHWIKNVFLMDIT